VGSLVPVCEDFDVYLIFEEWFELLGSGITLLALLYFAQTRLDDAGWRGQKRLLLIVAPLTGLLLAAYLWLLPGLEAGAATPINVEYGDFRLLAYQIEKASLAPGESLGITLYWQAEDWIETPLHLSLHALALPDLRQSFAQVDELLLGQIPSTAFVPGLPVRKQLYLPFAADVPDLQSYALVLRVWQGRYERDDLRGLEIVSSDQPLYTPDTVQVETVTLLDPQTFPNLSSTMDYRFADNLALRSVALPSTASAGQTLALSFRWASLGPIGRDLTQFLHLIDSEGNFVFGSDQPPFAGRLPTSDWPLSAELQDDWVIALPLDLPPGEYRVYTGLYELASLDRSAVSDTAGDPVPDNAILLGTLRISSD
jgi:hypothetical protein